MDLHSFLSCTIVKLICYVGIRYIIYNKKVFIVQQRCFFFVSSF